MINKKFIGLASGLAFASVIAIGSAAWVITNTDTKEAQGNVVVDTVTDNRVTLTVTATDNSVTFGGKADASITNPWLTFDSEKTEDLTLVLSYTVDFKDSEKTDNSKIEVAATSNAGSVLASVVEAGYITVGSIVVTTPDASAGTGTITLSFAWGEAFNNQNPYTYFNKLTADDTNTAKATTALNALAALKDTKITFTVTAKAKAA